jgi:hypothetical protein
VKRTGSVDSCFTGHDTSIALDKISVNLSPSSPISFGDDGAHSGAFGTEENIGEVMREFRGTQVGMGVHEKVR